MSMNIQTITTSDTIKQFMEKCNDNFSSIVENGGGPMGKKGETGETGATGKRGNKFHFVEIEGSDYSEEFPIEEAEELIKDLEDLEDGDFVLFSNGYICDVSLEEDGESSYSVIVNNLISIKGPKGDQGEQGISSEESLETRGRGLWMNMDDDTKKYLILSNSEFGGEPNNTLVIQGGIGFISPSPDNIEIGSIKLEDKLYINSEEKPISIISSNNINIGSSDSLDTKNFNVNTSQTINLKSKDIILDCDKINFNVNNSVSFPKLKVGDDNSYTEITKDSITSTNGKIYSLNATGEIIVGQTSGSMTLKTKINESGLNVLNDGFVVNSSNGITTFLPFKSETTITADNGDGEVLLDTPKFAMMLYSKYAKIPYNWEVFDSIQVPAIKTENDTKNISYDNEHLYCNCGNDSYTIIQQQESNTYNFLKHILTSKGQNVVIDIDNDTNFVYDNNQTLTYNPPPTSPGFVWIFKTK